MGAEERRSLCPYAQQLLDTAASAAEADGNDNDKTTKKEETRKSLLASNDLTAARTAVETMELAKNSCPAFQGGKTCPFKDAQGDWLRNIPSSHISALQQGGPVLQAALEQVHVVSMSLSAEGGDDKKPFVGKCPFSALSGNEPLVKTLEDLSLNSIISRLVAEQHGAHGDEHDDDDDKNKPQEADAAAAASLAAAAAAGALETPSAASRRPSISEALKTGTAESHQDAEKVHFVVNFVRGNIDRDSYAALLTNLYHVYRVMEEELAVHGPSHFSALYCPEELNRTEALEDDMEFFWGDGWQSRCPPSPACQDYLDRLRHLAKTDPLLLLAHSYTRYLGDLSGGRILARMLRRSLGFAKGDEDGLRFWHFDKITNAKQFKDDFRSSLDQLALTPEQTARMVAEANVAFILNIRLFEELDVQAGIPGASVRSVQEAIEHYYSFETRAGEEGTDADSPCPFAKLGGKNPHATKAARPQTHSAGRCPWPFVFFHDPVTGLKDEKTWMLLVVMVFVIWIWPHCSVNQWVTL